MARPRLYPNEVLQHHTVRLTIAQIDAMVRLGNSNWLRAYLDKEIKKLNLSTRRNK